MDNTILISIIIPTYNRLEYFKKALDSALNQSYRNIEIIITDDSTTDQIADYVITIHDNRIRYNRNKITLGISLNTKNGISISRGEYFCFLNDDDYWGLSFLEQMMKQIELNGNIGCAFCDHWLVNSNGDVLPEETKHNSSVYKRDKLETGVIPSNDRVDLFVENTIPVAMACVIKRSIIDLNYYPSEVGGTYDRWLMLQCVANKQCQFLYVNERLTFYRVHNQSASATLSISVAKSAIYVFVESKKLLKYTKLQKDKINKTIRVYIRTLVKRRNIESFKYLKLYFATMIN